MKYILTTSLALGLIAQSAFAQTAEIATPKPDLYPAAHYTAPINPGKGQTAFDFRLKGYVFGISMIKGRYKGVYSDHDYSVYTDLHTSGLGALLKKLRIWATTEGRLDKDGVHPVDHTQQNLDKKSRRVEMDYDYGTRSVNVSVVPPNGSQGIPPASPKQRFEGDDAVSAILRILLTGHEIDGQVCDDNVKVFDSKQFYSLRMNRIGTSKVKFNGQTYQAVKCNVFYEPISGFDPEDLPNTEEGGTPVKVYFIKLPDLDMNVPVRFTYKISGFKAVIKIKDFSYIKG